MYREEIDTSFGIARIHKDAIASIASIASLEVEGVSRLIERLAFKVFKWLIKKQVSAIKVSISKNGEISLDIPVAIKYGYNIPEVAYKIQENVKASLEKMTNMTIRQINVTIKNIERG